MRYSVTDYGAVGDGVTNNTAAFAAAVAACVEGGGGMVTVPAGEFVSGTIELKSNVYLELLPGAVILGSMVSTDYRGTKRGCSWKKEKLPTPEEGKSGAADKLSNACPALVMAENCHHVGITGFGMLDGRRGRVFAHGPEVGDPFLVVFSECEYVTVENITEIRPGSFTNYFLNCKKVTVRGLRIDSTGTVCGDGIDFDGGQDVTISDCHIDAGDDGIGLKTLTPDEPCERFTITNCTIRSLFWGCVRIGPETAGDYRHITISNCVFLDSNDGFKLQLCEERVFEDFLFSNITMDRVTRPFFITLNCYPFSVYSTSVRPPLGTMRRLKFQNITAHLSDHKHIIAGSAHSGCILYCLPGGKMEDITFNDVHLHCLGGGTPEEAARADHADMWDYVMQYPETCGKIGTLPSAAFYMRGADRVRLSNVTVTCDEPDARPAFVAERMSNLTLRDVSVRDTQGLLRHHECEGLTVRDCNGELITLTEEQKKQYDAVRKESRETDRMMAAVASLIDSLPRYPDEYFNGLKGKKVSISAGDVVYVPRVYGCIALTLDGKTVAEYILPEVYRTETRYAVRFAEDIGEGELKVSCPDGTELEKADVWLFKNPTV